MRTKAAVLVELNRPLEIMDLDLPDPAEGEVLVKIHASGLCHTQLLEIKGENAGGSHVPNLMGHEGSGIVEAAGKNVHKVKKEDRVILSWIKGKGADVCPKPLRHNGLGINRGPVTTFSQYSIVSENRVEPVQSRIDFRPAALIGCAVSTGMGMVFNNAKLKPGTSLMVVGVGGIGMSAVHAASLAGASVILAVDKNPKKLELAKALGATHTFCAGPDIRTARSFFPVKEGWDVAVDTVGFKDTMEFVYESVKKNSGRAILCGVPNPPGRTITVDPFPLYYGRQLVGTSGGETDPSVHFEKYCRMYLEGRLKLDAMISHVFPLEKINEGFDVMRRGDAVRVVIEPAA